MKAGPTDLIPPAGAAGEHTKFAYPITTAMSFNRTLWKATGAAIGREARALMNSGAAFSTFWAPVADRAATERRLREMRCPVFEADRGDAAGRDVDIPRANRVDEDRRPLTIERKIPLDGVGPKQK